MAENTSGTSTTNVSGARLKDFTEEILKSVGTPETIARITTDHLIGADLRGVDTHGIIRLPIYIERIEAGYMKPDALPIAVKETETTAVLDAQNGLGQFAAHRAMEKAIEKSKQHHLGAVTVRHSNHFGAAAEYTMMAANAGLLGFSSTNSAALMGPTGGTEPRIGNNPLSIAVPTDGPHPLVLDIAFSVVAAWNLVMAQKAGKKVPPTWALDSEGNPTDDPTAALDGGGMLRPVGDHKGYGLAFMMDVLCGVLSGGHFGTQTNRLKSEAPLHVAHFMMAINVEAFMPLDEFHDRISGLVSMIRSCPKAAGVDHIFVPGEPEHMEQLDRLKKGVSLSTGLLEELEELARRFNVPSLT